MKTDILIVGCGVAGLYSALHLPEDKHITIITKWEKVQAQQRKVKQKKVIRF